MLSIILNDNEEEKVVDYTEELLEEQTSKMDVEIIRASSWRMGLEMSGGDFLCYLEPDCLLSDDYLMVGMNAMFTNDKYRKLAMISPVLCARYWNREIHGYKNEMGEIVPCIPEDRKTYLPDFKRDFTPIQIGYFPGSIIRRSAANRLHFNSDTPLKSSVENSIALWEEGNRILLNPHIKYVSNRDDLEEPLEYGLISDEAMEIFSREAI